MGSAGCVTRRACESRRTRGRSRSPAARALRTAPSPGARCGFPLFCARAAAAGRLPRTSPGASASRRPRGALWPRGWRPPSTARTSSARGRTARFGRRATSRGPASSATVSRSCTTSAVATERSRRLQPRLFLANGRRGGDSSRPGTAARERPARIARRRGLGRGGLARAAEARRLLGGRGRRCSNLRRLTTTTRRQTNAPSTHGVIGAARPWGTGRSPPRRSRASQTAVPSSPRKEALGSFTLTVRDLLETLTHTRGSRLEQVCCDLKSTSRTFVLHGRRRCESSSVSLPASAPAPDKRRTDSVTAVGMWSANFVARGESDRAA